MGIAVNAAMSEKPKEALTKIISPPKYASSADLPAVSMLRPVYGKKTPKKKKAASE